VKLLWGDVQGKVQRVGIGRSFQMIHLALDNGVKPSEISEVITHLAFYSGWANAMSAVAKDAFW
jgi:Carboxymuconolactone decarboxylase family